MALVLQDRVREISTTTGTGTVTLSGAYPGGYRTFASCVPNGSTTYYCIHNTTNGVLDEWEVGIGTYSSNTLTRDTVLSSSSGGGKIVFSAGDKEVFITYPAEKSVYEDASSNVVQNQFTSMNVTGTATINVATITSGTVATTPSSATDIANKQYVDNLVASGITYHTPVKYEVPNTTGNLTATYNNGTGGVGATLTNAGTQTAFTPDGVVASVNDRVLIYNQTNAYENGVYTVTTVGSGSTNWVLTRATDADSYGLKDPNSLGEGDAFFITSGNTGAGETYVCNTQGTITFGTTAINFVQVSSAQIYSAGTGLNLSGTTFSVANTGVTAQTYGNASQVPQVIVNAQGQITSATNVAIAITASNVSGLAASATTDTTNASNITSGTLANARTTASSSNGASTIVARDASGNFSANTITANLTGNVTGNTSGTAGSLASAQNFQISGGATAANVAFDGSAAVNLNVTAMNASVINTGTIANIYTTASSSNGASTIVARDASGNFTANNVTATNIIAGGSYITSLNASVINSGVLAVSYGGTGLTSLTAGYIPYGNGTSAFSSSSGLYFSGTNLGVGTSSPDAKLEVNIAATADTRSVIFNRGISDGTFQINNWSGAAGGTDALIGKFGMSYGTTKNTYINFYRGGSGTGGYMAFTTNNDTERMRIDSSGNVGIGTSSPSYRVDAQVSSNVRIARFKNTSTTVQDYTLFTANDSDVVIGMGVYGSAAGTTGMFSANSPFITTTSELNLGATGGSGVIKFATGGTTERMRIDSSGNVGIGTSSPSGNLSIDNSDLPYQTFKRAGTVKTYFGVGNGSSLSGQASAGDTVLRAEQSLVFRTSGDTYGMKLDSSGNLGLGVTPSAWSLKAIEVGALGNGIMSGGASDFWMTSSAYYNSGWKYANTGSSSSAYQQVSGSHRWFNAASGTAGNAITFTQAMTLNASGNLALGTTTAPNSSEVRFLQKGPSSGSSGTYLELAYGASTYGGAAIGVGAAGGEMRFLTFTGDVGAESYSERMRIDSSGRVFIGTTSGTSLLNINGTGTSIASNGWDINPTTTTASAYYSFTNGGGTAYLGRDNSTGSVWGAAYATVLWANGAYPMLFGTNGNERMRITSSGNVGIGTSSPDALLHVYQTSGKVATFGNNVNNNGTYIVIAGSSSNKNWAIANNMIGGGALEFVQTSAAGGTTIGATPAMRIDNAGNALFAQAVRATITTDNDLSFDMNAASNFKCTPTAGGALTFTNITSGQTGNIILVNGSNYAITAAATTKVSATCLATISATGTYWLSYYSDGTNVYVANTGALA